MSIQRRNFLGSVGAAGLLGLVSPREQLAQEQAARATRAMVPACVAMVRAEGASA